MIQLTPHMRVFLCREKVDFRKGIDGLVGLCQSVFKVDPFSGAVFVFHNKRRSALKLLVYDSQGFWCCQKRLSQGRFQTWVSAKGGGLQPLAPHELQILLVNGDYRHLAVPPPWRPLKPAS